RDRTDREADQARRDGGGRARVGRLQRRAQQAAAGARHHAERRAGDRLPLRPGAASPMTMPAASWRREPVRWISHGFNNGLVFTLALHGSAWAPWWLVRPVVEIGARVLRRALAPATEALISNLGVVFPGESRRQLYRRTLVTYRAYAYDYVEFVKALSWSREQVQERFTYTNGEPLQRAMAMGRGVILVTGHFGKWEAGAIVMRALGVPLTVVARAEPDPHVNAYRLRIRESLGV